jgi:predicted MFS family arabinose efflux permease
MSVPDKPRERTPNRWLTLLTVVLVCFVGQSFARFSFGLLLPAMKADLGVTYGLAGWLATINLAGYLIGTLLTSVASLRFESHRIMQVGVALATIGMLILSTVSSVPLLLLAMLIGGIGGAASWIPAPVIAASVFAPDKRAFAMGSTSAAIGVGVVVASLLARGTRSIAGNPAIWRPLWVIEASVGVLATVLALRVLRPLARNPNASAPSLRALRQAPRWWALTLGYMALGLGYVLVVTYLVSSLEDAAQFSKAHAANVFALFGIGNAIGALGVGRVVDRLGQRLVMAVTYGLAGASCFVLLLFREPYAAIATFLFGLGMAGGVVCISSYVGRTLSPQHFSAAFGVVTACFGVAQMVGPRLAGWMIDRNGSFDGVFQLAGVVWFVGAGLALLLPSRSQLVESDQSTSVVYVEAINQRVSPIH